MSAQVWGSPAGQAFSQGTTFYGDSGSPNFTYSQQYGTASDLRVGSVFKLTAFGLITTHAPVILEVATVDGVFGSGTGAGFGNVAESHLTGTVTAQPWSVEQILTIRSTALSGGVVRADAVALTRYKGIWATDVTVREAVTGSRYDYGLFDSAIFQWGVGGAGTGNHGDVLVVDSIDLEWWG